MSVDERAVSRPVVESRNRTTLVEASSTAMRPSLAGATQYGGPLGDDTCGNDAITASSNTGEGWLRSMPTTCAGRAGTVAVTAPAVGEGATVEGATVDAAPVEGRSVDAGVGDDGVGDDAGANWAVDDGDVWTSIAAVG